MSFLVDLIYHPFYSNFRLSGKRSGRSLHSNNDEIMSEQKLEAFYASVGDRYRGISKAEAMHSLIRDIEQSEQELERGEYYSHEEVMQMSEQWLR